MWAALKSLLRKKNVFKNDAARKEPDEWHKSNAGYQYYKYTKPSKYLRQWSSFFQSVISQAGTYMLTKKFHTHECGIHKCEGGCYIAGVGDLVLIHDGCYFDSFSKKEEQLQQMGRLITEVVLAFDPMDPTNSIIAAACKEAGCQEDELTAALKMSHVGGVFGGDALSDFFKRNPFDNSPRNEEARAYYRWLAVDYLKQRSNEDIDQEFADEDLGFSLYNRLREKFSEQKCWYSPLCCAPSRRKDGLGFWINTGRRTNIDGWKTQKEIEDFLKPDVKIVDEARY